MIISAFIVVGLAVIFGMGIGLVISLPLIEKYENELKRIDIATNFRFRGKV